MANIISQQDLQDLAPDLDLSAFSAPSVSGIISQATRRMQTYCNVSGFDLATETKEESRTLIRNNGELFISLRRRPLVTLQTVTLRRSGFSSSLTLTDPNTGALLYQVPYGGSQVHVPNAYLILTGTLLAGGSSQLLTLKGANVFTDTTYVGGYATIPDDLKLACILFVRDILATQYNTAGASSFRQGQVSVSFGSSKDGKSRFVLQAQNILDDGNYVRREMV